MISISINNIKQFMNCLLLKNTFNNFLLSEAVIVTGNTFTIDGQINTDFYSDEELKTLPSLKYKTWASLKPFVLSLIKGNKVPELMRLVFVLSEDLTEQLIKTNDIDIDPCNVNGLFLNVRFQEESLILTSASSISVFTLDKSLDHAFENYIRNFLDDSQLEYAED